MKLKKILSNFSKIFIIVLISVFFWFCSYNMKMISVGTKQNLESIITNSYSSKNDKFYFEFINERLCFYKYKESNTLIHSITSKFTINEGLLIVDSFDEEFDFLNLIFLSDDRLYCVELNQLMYIN